jgi:choice-of-anchor B domain-containing protein
MKLRYLFIIILFSASSSILFAQSACVDGLAGEYPCKNVDLMSFIPNSEMMVGNNVNDVWGWTSPTTGQEFVMLGGFEGTAFIDITDPVNPIFIGFLPTHTVGSLWRDIKVYNNYAFIVSEAGSHGMQVFDLTILEQIEITPVTLVETAYYGAFGKAHNIAINEETGFAYAIGSNTFAGGLHIVNIQDPLNPVIAGGFDADGYTHDCQAVLYSGPDSDYSGQEIVFACNTDALTIVNVQDKTDCYLIATEGYAGVGYTHQGWLSPDQRYFYIGDELDEINFGGGTKTFIWDVQDLDNPVMIGIFENEVTAIDHNLYTLDNFIYQSNYRSGLRILDASNVENADLYEIGFFDEASFAGSWSNYPYFQSGVIPVTDMYDGLFLVKPKLLAIENDYIQVNCGTAEVDFLVDIFAPLPGSFLISTTGLPEDLIASGSLEAAPGAAYLNIQNTQDLAPGIYEFDIVLLSEFGEYVLTAAFEIIDVIPDAPALTIPENESEFENQDDIILQWDGVENAVDYLVEISLSPDFDEIFHQANTAGFTALALNVDLNNPELWPGPFYWRVTAIGNCNSSQASQTNTFYWIFVGVNEINSDNSLVCYPNPTNGILTVRNADNDAQTVQLFDSVGKLVLQQNLKSGNGRLDLSVLSKGVYTLRCGSQTRTIIRD